MGVCQETEECSVPSHWVGPRLELPSDDLWLGLWSALIRELRGNWALRRDEEPPLGGGTPPPRGAQGHPTLISGMQGEFVCLFGLLVAPQMPKKGPGS